MSCKATRAGGWFTSVSAELRWMKNLRVPQLSACAASEGFVSTADFAQACEESTAALKASAAAKLCTSGQSSKAAWGAAFGPSGLCQRH